jgi:hypothetical protein
MGSCNRQELIHGNPKQKRDIIQWYKEEVAKNDTGFSGEYHQFVRAK